MNLLEKKLKSKYPNELLTVLNYTRMKDYAQVQCNTCGAVYNCRAENFLRSTKTCVCLNCQKDTLGKNKYQQKINEKYPKEDILIIDFTGAKNKLIVKCNKCKNYYTFDYAENILAVNKKRVCSHCFPNKREAMYNTINNFKEWTLTNKYFRDFVFPDNINSSTLIESVCNNCNKKNYKTIYDYMKLKKCACMSNNERLTAEQYQKRIGNSYELLSPYQGLEHAVLIKHTSCGFIFHKTNAKNISCPHCKRKMSKGEQKIYDYLKENHIDFIQEYTVVLHNHPLRFDFYLPLLDVYIEYQGIQHYESIEFFGGQEQFNKQKEYDKLKKNFAKKKLLIIKYDENINEKIDSFLIKFNE